MDAGRPRPAGDPELAGVVVEPRVVADRLPLARVEERAVTIPALRKSVLVGG